MRELGVRAGREVVCELTDMDQPLGRAVGNALEIREAVDTLRGEGPEDLVELVLGASGHLLALSDLGVDQAEGRRRAEEALAGGAALEQYQRWIRAQGGDPSLDALPSAEVVRPVPAPEAGFVEAIAATAIGEAALRLGAGRARKEDRIDHAVGIVCLAKRGDPVESGAPLAEVHARSDEAADRAIVDVRAAYTIGRNQPPERSIVLDVIA
jgi:pyrimidine-nucleoside phosphorylase